MSYKLSIDLYFLVNFKTIYFKCITFATEKIYVSYLIFKYVYL